MKEFYLGTLWRMWMTNWTDYSTDCWLIDWIDCSLQMLVKGSDFSPCHRRLWSVSRPCAAACCCGCCSCTCRSGSSEEDPWLPSERRSLYSDSWLWWRSAMKNARFLFIYIQFEPTKTPTAVSAAAADWMQNVKPPFLDVSVFICCFKEKTKV